MAPLFEELTLPGWDNWHEMIWDVTLEWASPESGRTALNLRFNIELDVTGWAKAWSIRDFINRLTELARSSGWQGLEVINSTEEYPRVAVHVECEPDPADSSEVVLQKWGPLVTSMISGAEEQLASEAQHNKLIALFRFPDEISVACQQYLLYFVQFLADLGVEATAEIKNLGPQILFGVTPTSGREALGRIREALDAYLQLPSLPQLREAQDDRNDIAHMQLRAQLSLLQAQLELARATIQQKDATIELLNVATYELRRMAGGGHFLPTASEREPDHEDVFGGYVSVKPLATPVADLNVPRILRALKRRFRK